MKNTVLVYEINAFSNQPNQGSPTGVVLIADDLTADDMQQLARKVPYSHTAFLTEAPQTDLYDVKIRFFTARGELRNCGHATIAAHWLRAHQQAINQKTVVLQETLSGIQSIEIHADDNGLSVHFEQNAIVITPLPNYAKLALLDCLHITDEELHPSYPPVLASPGTSRFLVGVKSKAILNRIKPNFPRLKALCEEIHCLGCFMYAIEETTPVRAIGRMFAPTIGVNEDIINGNSSGCLAAFLLHHQTTMKHIKLEVQQGHLFNRAGMVLVSAHRDNASIQTTVGGAGFLVGHQTVPL